MAVIFVIAIYISITVNLNINFAVNIGSINMVDQTDNEIELGIAEKIMNFASNFKIDVGLSKLSTVYGF
ncbi:hypothetical protein [Methanogenium sp. MK-MG]|uniref:hypothetical protein n=1 Tax=Methanogenium sp. MK-MG TaxID=2599926 RepID=UPI0013E9D83A|nr:hypothetical protein [Methanogenium sp. MK-MG]KAF1077909.1 hypothetical protein MKMG_01165 [Methanogenium sp. MK-MG]